MISQTANVVVFFPGNLKKSFVICANCPGRKDEIKDHVWGTLVELDDFKSY